ncbi:AMP-dependent synthetase, partial [Burkholderia multivorans]
DDAVIEAAVVGRPDEIRGEVIEAFVVVDPAVGAEDGLVTRLQNAVRGTYGAHAYPRRVHIVEELPKTPSGKVQRFVLRDLEV